MRTMKSMVFLAGLAAFGMTISSANAAVWGPNLITNGDFENGTTGWAAGSGTINGQGGPTSGVITIANSADTPGGTGSSMTVICTPEEGNLAIGTQPTVAASDPGATFELTLDFKNPAGYLYVRIYLSDSSILTYDGGAPTSQWTPFSKTFTLNPGVSIGDIFFMPPAYDFGDGQTSTLYLDNVSLRQEVVPEPASFVLFGLPALALGLRRRRR